MARKFWRGGMQGAGGKQGDFQTGLIVNATLKNTTSVVDLGGTPNRVRFETTAVHSINEFDYVVIVGTDSYDNEYLVVNVSDTTHFDIEATYIAETFAGTETVKGSNWSDVDGVPCAIPAAADEIFFDNSARLATAISTRHTENEHWNCIDGMARANTGGIDYGLISVEEGFTGNIGIDAEKTKSEFNLSIAAGGKVVFRGAKQAYFKCAATNATTDSDIPVLIVDTLAGFIEISSDVNSASYKSEWTTVKCFRQGRLKLAENTVVKNLYTHRQATKIEIGAGCVEIKTSSDPLDLYIGDNGIYNNAPTTVTVLTDGTLTFGTASIKINTN